MRSAPATAGMAALFLCAAVGAQQASPPPPAEPGAVVRNPKVGSDYTPGWDMMTPQERDAYRQRMFAAPTPDECRRMRDEQTRLAAQRARNRGIKDVPNPRYDACE